MSFRSDSPAGQIKERLTMDQVARHYGFEPNRAGFIRCPFHQGDHTASLKLYPGDRGWYCFGCNRGGSVIDFVMELFHLDFRQAVVRLDADFRLGLTADKPTRGERSEILARRREEAERAERERAECYATAREHQYWWEVQKTFAPTREDWEAGYVHPLYLEALRRLPELRDYLDRDLTKTR